MLSFICLSVLVFSEFARATSPSCAVLFCGEGQACDERFNRIWLAAAQEEAARSYDTRNGGWLAPDCTTGSKHPRRVKPFEHYNAHLVACIDPSDLPEEQCAEKKCNFASHPELFTDECDDGRPYARHKSADKDNSACRTLGSWLEIANRKLVESLDLTDAEDFDAASSAACVADFLFRFTSDFIVDANPGCPFPFLSEEARTTQRYTHINSVVRRGMFETSPSDVEIRAVQSIRSCGEQEPGVASAILYPRVANSTDTLVTTQVLWAVGGTLSDFHSVQPFDSDNTCVDDVTSLETFVPTRRLDGLSPSDYGVVRGDGDARFTLDLRAAATCPMLTLYGSVTSNENGSFAQIVFRAPPAARSPEQFSLNIEDAVYVRVATGVGQECEDYESLVWVDALGADEEDDVAPLQRSPGVPMTLAPGESVCVGGDRDGQACEAASECNVGESCKRKPLGRRDEAYCYDGLDWHENRPCAFADENDACPYGQCVGAVNGVDGGAYPYLHLYIAHDCTHDTTSPVCRDQRVRNWHLYPSAGGVFGSLAQGGNGPNAPVMPAPTVTIDPSLTAAVLIGGAGYAGVSAANQLQQRGVTFRLLEAVDYVGDRMVVANGGKGNNYNPPGHVHPARGVKRDTDLTDGKIDQQFAEMGTRRLRAV